MKKLLQYINISILLTAMFAVTVMAQTSPYFYSMSVRNNATFHKALTGDNSSGATNILAFTNEDGTARLTLDSAGNFSVAGTVTSIGKSALDSLTVGGESRFGGLVSYDQMLSIKNNAVNTKVQSWYNSRNTLLAYVDSSGVFNADTLVIDDAARFGGLIDYTSRFSIKGGAVHANLLKIGNEDGTARLTLDSAGALTLASSLTASGASQVDSLKVVGDTRLGGLAAYMSRLSVKNNAVNTHLFSLYNSRNTAIYQIDSVGVEYSAIAGIDSFTTTAATDSVTLSSTSGLTTSSKPFVWKINPTWSTDVDTAEYSGQVVLTGAGLWKLAVTRVKSYTGNGATAVKSGGHYAYDIRK